MNHEEFRVIFNDQFECSADILIVKAAEYATDEDRLSNFRKAAGLSQINQREALFGMLRKHLVSISDLCAKEDTAPLHTWNEKITDSINYLILLRAMVAEEITIKEANDTD